MSLCSSSPVADPRLAQIAQARRAFIHEERTGRDVTVQAGFESSWIARSWRRCLAAGHRPQQRVDFNAIPAQALRRAEEANHELLQAARPVLGQLGRAIAHSRYFAILTDAQGLVIGVDGAVDRSDRRADLIARVGVDLSEAAVGTVAVGAVLIEQQPLWLHRGEHFFDDTAVYSCAGVPVLGPDGRFAGVLDLTGVDAPERPELKHLAAQSARRIENAMVLAVPQALLLRLNWPGHALGGESDGLIGLDADGYVVSANPVARQMVGQLAVGQRSHCSELFALPWEVLFDTLRRDTALEVPLWSGLTLQVLGQQAGQPVRPRVPEGERRLPLKDLEAELIRRSVQVARGNVTEAARMLGISRATVYRKLGVKPKG